MTNRLSLQSAVAHVLAAQAPPAFLAYHLGRVVFELVAAGEYQGETLNPRSAVPQLRHYRDVERGLLAGSLLIPVRGVPDGAAYQLPGAKELDAAQLVCLLDPFCFLSHLSAMATHGLTDRVPHTLFVSSPDPKSWRAFAQERTRKDLGERLDAYVEAGFPTLRRIQPERLLGKPIHFTKSLHLGAFKTLESSRIRVASVGRTFLDMIRLPDLCGGIAHVLEVYAEHAATYLPLIVAEVDQHGEPIDKVRAGYLLDERCGLSAPSIQAWMKHVQRGGSRKLVGHRPYSATYSEKWCLSLNMD